MNEMKEARVLDLDGREITVIESKTPNAPAVYLIGHGQDERAGEFLRACVRKGCRSFSLVLIPVYHWDEELSPWKTGPQISPEDHFTGQAPQFLSWIENRVIPAAESLPGMQPSRRIILGYSMAGLFAVDALYHCDCFDEAGCISGSLWFDGFGQYARTHLFAGKVEAIYCSLGNTEVRTRDPRLQKTGQIMEALCTLWKEQGIETVFEWNSGNHFQDIIERQAKGLAWLLRQPNKKQQ